MTENEFKVFSFIQSHPDVQDHIISRKIDGLDQSKVLSIVDTLVHRGLVYKTTPDWERYTASNWNDVPFGEQIDHALMVLVRCYKQRKWALSLGDFKHEFNNELAESDAEAIVEYLIQNKMGMNLSSKNGTCIGCTTKTLLAYKQKEYLHHVIQESSVQPDHATSAGDFKRAVLKFLDRHGDTFVDIGPVLLDFQIHQAHLKYLLDDLQQDNLIILAKNNPPLNSNQHTLNPSSNVRARSTPTGQEYVKLHYDVPSPPVNYNFINTGTMTGVFAQGSTVESKVVKNKVSGIPKPESFLSKILWYIIVPFGLMVLIYYLGMN